MVEGKNEEMSTSELSGGARIHYIFQSIFVKSLEVGIMTSWEGVTELLNIESDTSYWSCMIQVFIFMHFVLTSLVEACSFLFCIIVCFQFSVFLDRLMPLLVGDRIREYCNSNNHWILLDMVLSSPRQTYRESCSSHSSCMGPNKLNSLLSWQHLTLKILDTQALDGLCCIMKMVNYKAYVRLATEEFT